MEYIEFSTIKKLKERIQARRRKRAQNRRKALKALQVKPDAIRRAG